MGQPPLDETRRRGEFKLSLATISRHRSFLSLLALRLAVNLEVDGLTGNREPLDRPMAGAGLV
jgi:hypothetical protein